MAGMPLTHVDDIEGTFSISEFSDYIGTKLQISVGSSDKNFLVFWKKEDDESDSCQTLFFSSVCPSLLTPPSIKGQAKIALQHLDLSFSIPILAQFWVPVSVGGRRFLSTSDQPFGLTILRKGLCWYGKQCLNYFYWGSNSAADGVINIGTRESVVTAGPPSRVFLRGLPEYSPNVEFYSKTEYPMRDEAMRSKIKNYMAVPVFGPIQQCIGVLELVSAPGLTGEIDKPTDIFGSISTALQGAGLRTSNFTSHFQMEKELAKSSTGLSNALCDIHKALEDACQSHNLPFAQTWTPWSGENQSYTGGVHVLVTTSSQYCLSDKRFSLLRDTCESFQLLRGRGVVWTAFSSGNPCFCRDIAMLSIAEYSFSHVARKALLDSSFAICLKSDHTAENVYVLELFLPSKTANPRQVLESVLLTMKKHLNGFRLASGKQLGDEMHVEVLRVSMDDKLDFFRLFHAAGGSVELQDRHNSSMHPVMLTGLGIRAIHNASFAAIEEQESLELLQDDKHDSFTFFNAVDGSVEQQDHHNSSRHQQLLSGKNSASNCKRTDRETLEKHFNLKRKEAAQHLNMCESTLKRNCRAVGIKVWPYKKNQATCSPTGIESNKGNEKHDPKYGQEGLNSNMSTEEGTTSSQQNISQDAMGSGGSMMTIKAVYRGKTIKFRLPFNSSKLVDMETEVASRLKLKVGDFDIWYPDEDDDWIVLTCDVDLRIMESMGKTTITVYITDAAGDPIKGLAMEHLILE